MEIVLMCTKVIDLQRDWERREICFCYYNIIIIIVDIPLFSPFLFIFYFQFILLGK